MISSRPTPPQTEAYPGRISGLGADALTYRSRSRKDSPRDLVAPISRLLLNERTFRPDAAAPSVEVIDATYFRDPDAFIVACGRLLINSTYFMSLTIERNQRYGLVAVFSASDYSDTTCAETLALPDDCAFYCAAVSALIADLLTGNSMPNIKLLHADSYSRATGGRN